MDYIALKRGKIQENMISCAILVLYIYHFKANAIHILKNNVIETENKPIHKVIYLCSPKHADVNLNENWPKIKWNMQVLTNADINYVYIINYKSLTKLSILSWFFKVKVRFLSLEMPQSPSIWWINMFSRLTSGISGNVGFFHFRFDGLLILWRCYILYVPSLLFPIQCPMYQVYIFVFLCPECNIDLINFNFCMLYFNRIVFFSSNCNCFFIWW